MSSISSTSEFFHCRECAIPKGLLSLYPPTRRSGEDGSMELVPGPHEHH